MPTPSSSDQRHTRDRILDAAENVFMEFGYEGASIRRITSDAGVNLAAGNYHFGSKEALFQAVLGRRLQALNQERLRLLDELEAKANGAPLKASQIVEAFFGALFRIGHEPGGETFLRLLGRTLTEPAEFIRAVLAKEYANVSERYQQALYRALPEVPKDEILWRFHFMLGATSYAIAGTSVLSMITDEWTNHSDDAELLMPRLMSFLLGGLRAPLPDFNNDKLDSNRKPS